MFYVNHYKVEVVEHSPSKWTEKKKEKIKQCYIHSAGPKLLPFFWWLITYFSTTQYTVISVQYYNIGSYIHRLVLLFCLIHTVSFFTFLHLNPASIWIVLWCKWHVGPVLTCATNGQGSWLHTHRHGSKFCMALVDVCQNIAVYYCWAHSYNNWYGCSAGYCRFPIYRAVVDSPTSLTLVVLLFFPEKGVCPSVQSPRKCGYFAGLGCSSFYDF